MKFVPKKLEHTENISRGSTNYGSLGLAIIAFLGFMIAIYFSLGVVVDQMSQRVDDQTEVQLLGVLGQAFPSMEIESDSESARRFESAKHVFEQLMVYPKLRKLPFELRLIDLDVPNAFAIPGGVVAVSPPLFDWVKSDGGLAFVLAHELAHHQKRHVTRRLGRGLLLALLETLMGAGGSSTVSFGALSQLTLAQYSQEQELEADDFAIEIMNTTLGNTKGALEFLQRALQESASDESATPWSSHPPTEARLTRLKTRLNLRID
jgi:beta-barrel assembly-enhancing protease